MLPSMRLPWQRSSLCFMLPMCGLWSLRLLCVWGGHQVPIARHLLLRLRLRQLLTRSPPVVLLALDLRRSVRFLQLIRLLLLLRSLNALSVLRTLLSPPYQACMLHSHLLCMCMQLPLAPMIPMVHWVFRRHQVCMRCMVPVECTHQQLVALLLGIHLPQLVHLLVHHLLLHVVLQVVHQLAL